MELFKAYLTIITVSSLILFSLQGCFKEVVKARDPLPDIIWPKPPEVPRIRFVNSLKEPEDAGITDTVMAKFLRFFKGTKKSFIVTPYGVIADDDGRIFIVDNFMKYVHVFNADSNVYYSFPVKDTSLVSPIDIAIDKHGSIYVSDSQEGVVKVFSDDGRRFVKEMGRGVLSRPTGLAVNKKTDELLIVDTINSEIVRYDIASHKFKGTFGSGGDSPGTFHNPTGIFTDGAGRIYVSDSLNFRVQIFSPEGEFIRTFGKAGDSPGFFARPKGIAVDSEGNIYVVDALFDNVQIFNNKGELLMAFGGPGNDHGYFWLPSGIFIDSHDRIYVADSYNHRVQIFQYIKSDGVIK